MAPRHPTVTGTFLDGRGIVGLAQHPGRCPWSAPPSSHRDPSSHASHRYVFMVISPPGTGGGLPPCCLLRVEASEERQALLQNWGQPPCFGDGSWGEWKEGSEDGDWCPCSALGAGMALGSLCAPASSVLAKRAMVQLPLVQENHTCKAERGSGMLAARTAGTRLWKILKRLADCLFSTSYVILKHFCKIIVEKCRPRYSTHSLSFALIMKTLMIFSI